MRCSRNEIHALALKAAVGSGLDYGSAQDAARATVALCAENPGGLGLLLRELLQPDELSAMVARASLDTSCSDLEDKVFYKALIEPSSAPASGHLEVDDTDIENAKALAALTYVPATETSRLRGAGAGTTDSD